MGVSTMSGSRRNVLQLLAAATAFAGSPRLAFALDYPTRPVRLIVGFPAGGPNDILARLIAVWLSEKLGQPFVVEDQPGSASNIATAAVVRAPADGYTLLMAGPANAINGSLFPSLGFDFLRDIAPVAGLIREPLVMLVNPAVPAASVAELIAYARSNPGKVRLALTDPGSAPHATGELFRMATGLSFTPVRYNGGPAALKGTVAGEADLMFEPISASFEPVKAGRLKALAVTTAEQSQALPGVGAVSEIVPGFEASSVNGIGAPRDTPPDIIDALNKAINAALVDPGMKARLTETGASLLPGSPQDFGRLMTAETEKWAKVVKFAGGKPD
jgi:tripartite-type tricarboxylate transporter receptor subunit TctC